MKRATSLLSIVAITLIALPGASVQAEQHRATHLGNPATRFAPPLTTTADLRARFADEKLQPDIASIVRQSGSPVNLDDLYRAARTNEIIEWKIPVGTTMPFMSSRENGKPICLRNVLWAGQEPAPAYAFFFTSNGRRYRCITPKACSNFFLEDLGPEIIYAPVLSLQCDAPPEMPTGRSVDVCLTVINSGNAIEPKTTITLPIPPGAILSSKTDRAVVSDDQLTWEIADLAPNHGKQVCAVFKLRQPGTLDFAPTAAGSRAQPVQSACATKIVGVPGILVEVVDREDPIEIGKQVTYDIKVTNQGSTVLNNIGILCTVPVSQEFISAAGITPGHAQERTVTLEKLPKLEPKASASWRVVTKALAAADARFLVEVSSDQFEKPIAEDEATQLY